MDAENKPSRIKLRQDAQKQQMLEQLQKVPIIQVCCERTNIGRASFYRWLEQDPKFKEEVNKALKAGIELVNDVAESALIGQIKEGNVTSIIYWLKNNSSRYREKLEVSTKRTEDEDLTSDQESIVNIAMGMAQNYLSNPTQNGKTIEPANDSGQNKPRPEDQEKTS